jgi:hypothetical protein
MGSDPYAVVLSLIVATMFWVNGDPLAVLLHDALRRLGGRIAGRALDVAAGAIRGGAYCVVGTAIIQAVLASPSPASREARFSASSPCCWRSPRSADRCSC